MDNARAVEPFGPVVEASAFEAWQAESRAVDRLGLVFIVGPPRCGTTWLLASLMGHPSAIGFWGETHAASVLLPALSAVLSSGDNHQPCETHAASVLLPELRRAVQTHNDTLDTWRVLTAPRISDEDSLHLERQAFDRVIISLLKSAGRLWDPTIEVFIEKSPTHSQQVDRLARLYPWSKFIIASRDVRDAAVSWWFHCKQWYKRRRSDHERLMDFAERYARREWAPRLRAARRAGETLGPQRCIEIDYAEHKADPEHVVARALRFLGLDDSAERVRACVEHGAFQRLSSGRQPGEEAAHFYRKGVVGDWANHLTSEQGERLLEIAREALRDYATPLGAEQEAPV